MEKVLLATDNFYLDFAAVYSNLEIFDPTRNYENEFDLVIFSGGEDVSPYLYLPQDQANFLIENGIVSYNDRRDFIEATLFDKIFSREIKTSNILGICRGIQLINVLLGGTLYPDLPTEGLGHNSINHRLTHSNTSLFSKTIYTNSLHHQGVWQVGNFFSKKRIEFSVNAMARESETGIPEIIEWTSYSKPKVKILGIQFHPEFFRDGPEKKYIFDTISTWCKK